MPHTCPAEGCAIVVPDHILMCRPHWSALPQPLRKAIYATYTPGRSNHAHLANVRSAIAYLRQARGDAPAIKNGVPIPAITVWQPWAALIAAGAKPYEFRSWKAPSTTIGRRIAIHAGARPFKKDEVKALLVQLAGRSWRSTGLVREPAQALLERVLIAPQILHYKATVCTALLGQPLQNQDLAAAMGIEEAMNDSDRHAHTNYGWPLSDIRVLDPPIPGNGAMGFFQLTVPAEHAA